MTEPERIRKEGWLPASFWEEEVKCDYKISRGQKKVWAVELDLFREFERVCTAFGLSYFAIGGTLLGAVRHKGFIPWDDDLDVVMPREDYQKLKSLACQFKHPYFLQSPDTDPEYGYSFLKLRNSETACIVDKFKHCRFNHGIFLDIFPIDYATEEDFAPRYEQIAELIAVNAARMKKGCPYPTERDKEAIAKYYDSKRPEYQVFHEIEAIAASCSGGEYRTVLTCTMFPVSRKKWLTSSFEDYELMDFEGMKMRVPKGWEQVLESNFGDWREFPPVENRGNWHVADFNTDRSYMDILGRRDEEQPMVSIICCAYNHGKYIRECLEGFVSQKTTFKYEAIVHDDASSDETAAVIREFEEKYPDIIKPVYQSENQYSTGIGIMKTYIYPRAAGKYIALCEGDDYWIDPLKLQKQVDFMEANPDYSLCCSNIYRLNDRTGEKWCRYYKKRLITLNELIYERNRIPTLSSLMKRELVLEYIRISTDFPKWPMGDLPMWIWMASKGKIHRFLEQTGVYRILEESASHSKDKGRRFFFRLSGFEIRLFFCRLLKKPSAWIWIRREIFVLKYVLKNFSGQRDKIKYMFKVAWPIK